MAHFANLRHMLKTPKEDEKKASGKDNTGLEKFNRDFKNLLDKVVIPAFLEVGDLLDKHEYKTTFSQNKSKKISDLGESLLFGKEWRKIKFEIVSDSQKRKVNVRLYRIPNSKTNTFVKYSEKLFNIDEITYPFLEDQVQEIIKKL